MTSIGQSILLLFSGIFISGLSAQPSDSLALNYHLMHPGEESEPGDPNAAFYLDGTYHLHYILRHNWQGNRSFSFIHVTSPDMLHWTWQPTKLQPSFTGHGMFSGTGLLTSQGQPAVIYHGQGSGRNQIALAKDRKLSAWEKPYAIEVYIADGSEAEMRHWDPDCFLIGDTYYAISGGEHPPVFKSKDLENWTYIGPFLSHEPVDVVLGEDISCANFFPLGDKWMLLCISHPYGCRYYLGEWDAQGEQFVPEKHGRMNWLRTSEGQTPNADASSRSRQARDFFAPESLVTPDGRRVMWAWLRTVDQALRGKTIQSLPRELSLAEDGALLMRPLRELETLRYNRKSLPSFTIESPERPNGGFTSQWITDLPGEACEILVSIQRSEAERKRFGLRLFANSEKEGLAVTVKPSTGTLRLGTAEAPFAVKDLPEGEDVELRFFVDKYLVEVFVNDRQAMVAAHMDWQSSRGLEFYTYGEDTTVHTMEIWELRPTNQGYLEAWENRIWEPDVR